MSPAATPRFVKACFPPKLCLQLFFRIATKAVSRCAPLKRYFPRLFLRSFWSFTSTSTPSISHPSGKPHCYLSRGRVHKASPKEPSLIHNFLRNPHQSFSIQPRPVESKVSTLLLPKSTPFHMEALSSSTAQTDPKVPFPEAIRGFSSISWLYWPLRVIQTFNMVCFYAFITSHK